MSDAGAVAVLGGGVGGTLVANLLDKALGRRKDATSPWSIRPGCTSTSRATCTSRSARRTGDGWCRDERSLLRQDVDLIIDRAIRIHPDAGTVQLERGASVDWDYLVIATGARLMHDRIPGLVEGAFGFYSLDDAQRLREAPPVPRGPDPRRHRRHPLQVPAGARGVRVHARGVPAHSAASATGAA